MGKSLFKDVLQDWSHFLVHCLVVGLTGAKVSQLVSSCHFKHCMTCTKKARLLVYESYVTLTF